jgi:hypothetical protein
MLKRWLVQIEGRTILAKNNIKGLSNMVMLTSKPTMLLKERLLLLLWKELLLLLGAGCHCPQALPGC